MSPSHTVIVTGAGSGLGYACVRHFASLGFHIACCDISHPNDYPDSCTSYIVDVTQTDSIEAMLAGLDSLPPIRALINCAGIAAGARVLGRDAPMPLADFQRVIDVNLIGTFNITRLTAAKMCMQPDCDRVVINTSSIAATDGQLGQVAYSAAKGGIAAMTLPMAREFKQFAIRVVAIAPGLMETPMTTGMSDKVQAQLHALSQYPQRFGQPSEFAQLAGHVVDNAFLNGCVLRLDGAVRLS